MSFRGKSPTPVDGAEQPIVEGEDGLPPMMKRFVDEGAGNQEEGKQETKEEEAERKLLELVSDDDGELELEPEEELTPSEQESLANETRIGRSSRRQLRIYKKLLRKGRISKRQEHFKHMDNFFASEEIMHGRGDKKKKQFLGRHSTKLYDDIVSAFEFDEFHRPVFREKESRIEMMKKLRLEEEEKGKEEAKQAAEASKPGMFDAKKQSKMLQSEGLNNDTKPLDCVSFANLDLVHIGYKPAKFAPAGLAMPQKRELNSEDNHNYYSYFGHWRHGLFKGEGYYNFADGLKYEGQWVNNRQEGYGVTHYKNGSRYEGYWTEGMFHGDGLLEHPTGSFYEGQFCEGRRGGRGKVMYPTGQYYEGGWACGVVHGRGTMRGSHDAPFEFRGTFINGRIQGTGMLVFQKDHWMFPKGNFKGLVMRDLGRDEKGKEIGWAVLRNWPRITFQELVLMVIEEELEYWEEKRWEIEDLQEVLREEQLQAYVHEVREQIEDEKAEEQARLDEEKMEERKAFREEMRAAKVAAQQDLSDDDFSSEEDEAKK